MYESSLENTWALFGDCLQGYRDAIIVVISSKQLQDQAKKALENSFARLGYQPPACTFVSLEGFGDLSLPALNEKDLFSLVEGLDPLFLVITDKDAAQRFAFAYRRDVPLDKRSRVFGREVRAFASFETMLEDFSSKQIAWALLKSLPKLVG